MSVLIIVSACIVFYLLVAAVTAGIIARLSKCVPEADYGLLAGLCLFWPILIPVALIAFMNTKIIKAIVGRKSNNGKV